MHYIQAADRSRASGLQPARWCQDTDSLHPPSPRSRGPSGCASRTGNDAAPAFVQLRVVGADVVSYIPQTKERLTAERTRPVLALDVPEAMHD